MFYQNTPDVIRQIKELVYTRLKLFKRGDNREVLIECMENTGYIEQSQQLPPEDDFREVEYRERTNREQTDPQQFIQGITEREHSSFITGTGIEQSSDPRFARLRITQTYGISTDEMTSAQLSELFETVLNQVSIKYQGFTQHEEIKRYAIDMYFRIQNVYRQTNQLKGEMKASVKRGYTLLVLYYALLHFGICVSTQELLNYFNYNPDVLAEADKNIKMVFGEELPDINETCLCNMKPVLGKYLLQIRNELKLLKENRTFHTPVQAVQVAALIHLVTKMSIKTISGYSGISADTIRKNVKQYFP